MQTKTSLTIEEIIKDPFGSYVILHSRLTEFGANAPFPEFQPAVEAIVNAIESARFAVIFNDHPDLLMEKNEVMTVFTHLNLTFYFDNTTDLQHPYQIPFDGPYPYRPTLEAIEAGIKLLDKLNRLEPGNRAVPFYHFDRYAYHKFGIFGNPDVVIMPIAQEIDFYDLLRIRSVPIGFIGVITETIRVDRHWQSPLDFWYHDINHVRRMTEYFKMRMKEQGITNPVEKYKYYREMDDFLNNVIVPYIQNAERTDEKDFALKKMLQILVFEVVHESALTAEIAVILKEILRPAGPQPFEHMLTHRSIDNIEQLRTPTGNIASGASVIEESPLETLSVRYFFDRSLGFLSTVFNKLNFGFYDDPEHPSDMVVPVNYRTAECIIEATYKLYELFDVPQNEWPESSTLMGLITARDGSNEKYVYKGVLVDEGRAQNIGSYATDPMPVKLIIKQIYGLDKKVCLFMGYSDLGYENESEMLAIVRKKLSDLDPEKYVVCIGATAQGIGAGYMIAKEMGFETIGIVSTLVLSAAGTFSPFVDRIYIVNDDNWGGYVPGTNLAAPTTRAFLEVADVVHAIGGGNNTAVLLQIAVAQYADIVLTFTPANMKLEKAKKKSLDPAGSASKVSLIRSHKK